MKWLKLNLFLSQKGFENGLLSNRDTNHYLYLLRNSKTDTTVTLHPNDNADEWILSIFKTGRESKITRYRLHLQKGTATKMWDGTSFYEWSAPVPTDLFSCLESILSQKYSYFIQYSYIDTDLHCYVGWIVCVTINLLDLILIE